MATLETYRTIVQRTCDTTSTSDTNLIDQYIQEIYQDILRQTAKYLVGAVNQDTTATVGTSSYTNNDFLELYAAYWKGVDKDDYVKMTEITEDEYLKYHVNDDNGTSGKYYIKGLTINLVPPPDEAGTLRTTYIATPDELTGDTVSLVPDRFKHVIDYGASSKFFAFEKGPEADSYERYYINALADMVNELKTKGRTPRPSFYARSDTRAYRGTYYDGLS